MKSGRSIQDVSREILRQQEAKADYLVATDRLHMDARVQHRQALHSGLPDSVEASFKPLCRIRRPRLFTLRILSRRSVGFDHSLRAQP